MKVNSSIHSSVHFLLLTSHLIVQEPVRWAKRTAWMNCRWQMFIHPFIPFSKHDCRDCKTNKHDCAYYVRATWSYDARATCDVVLVLVVGGHFSVPPRTVWICCFLPISRIPCLEYGSRIGGFLMPTNNCSPAKMLLLPLFDKQEQSSLPASSFRLEVASPTTGPWS